jgi:hypothetical protein
LLLTTLVQELLSLLIVLLLPVPVELMLFEEDPVFGKELILLIVTEVKAVLLLVALPLLADPPVVLPLTLALPLVAVCELLLDT